MKLHFAKYQGTGNDFILIDNRDEIITPEPTLIQKLTDRKFGIGADGLMLIQNNDQLDFEMVYFNSDGSKSLCGNGSRCAVDYARSLGIIGNQTSFLTTDGAHKANFDEGMVYFQLHDVNEVQKLNEYEYFIDTGSPHHIVFVEDLSHLEIKERGAEIRYSSRYPKGTNVNFVQKMQNRIQVRTYERGVEDETLSCGTGVTAAALAASLQGYQSPVKIETLGGNLTVTFEQKSTSEFNNIYLAGPATKVFEGSIEI